MIVGVFVWRKQTSTRVRWSEGIKGESKEAGGLQAIVTRDTYSACPERMAGHGMMRASLLQHPDLRLNMFHFCAVYCDNRFEMTSFLSTAFFPFWNTSYPPILDSDDTIFVIHIHSNAEQTESPLSGSCRYSYSFPVDRL
jgi:hypothetical protein